MKAVLIIVVWLLQIALVTLGFNAEWMREQRRLEEEYVTQYVGREATDQLTRETTHAYVVLFVKTGVAQQSYEQLLPDRGRNQQGMEHLAPAFFTWLRQRLDAWWWLCYGALFRL